MHLFARRKAHVPPNGYSVIDEHLVIAGDLSTEGTVRVDGRIEGSLHRTHTLIVGDGASVVGNIEAREVVIAGELTGNLMVYGRVEVQKSGTVRGDIRAASVMLVEGGTVHGHVLIQPLEVEMPAIGEAPLLALTPGRGVAAVAQG